MTARILFTEQFYFPEGWGGAQIPRDITMHLARSGFEVRVLCGSDQYAAIAGDTAENPAVAGVRVHRLPSLFGGNVKRLRALRQLWFCALAAPAILLARRTQAVIAQTNPAPLIPLL